MLAWTVGGRRSRAPPGGHGKGERHRDPTVTSPAVRVVAAADGDVGLGGNIHYDVWDDGRLVLRNAPVDGSYSIDVSVSAVGSSGRPRPGGSSRARSWSAGRRWSWEDDYYRAVDGCLDQLSDLAEEIGREKSARCAASPGSGPAGGSHPPRSGRVAARLKSRDAGRAAELERLVALRYGVAIAPED